MTDVLDQLIVIGDNVEDVTAYLKSFVGGGDAALTKFAADVKRFKLGEEIMESTKTVESVADKKQSEEEKETLHMQQQRKNDEGQKKRLQHQRPEEPKNHGGQQSSQTKTKLPQKPIKGKANKICGCYGNKHKPLTNCLHCGRISCEAEGFDFCPFCHNLIEDFRKEKADTSALLHKERLLQFDRTSAARTNILDDQAASANILITFILIC